MNEKFSKEQNVAILREAIKRIGLRCHITPDEGLFKFQERGEQTVFYFPKKNRYRLAGTPVDHFANANEFINWYLHRPEMHKHVMMRPTTTHVFVGHFEGESVMHNNLPREKVVNGMGYTADQLKERAHRGGEATKNRVTFGPATLDLNWSEGPAKLQPQDDNEGAAPCSSN